MVLKYLLTYAIRMIIYVYMKFNCPHCGKEIPSSELARHMGKVGGAKNKSKGTEYFKKISKLATEARWHKKI